MKSKTNIEFYYSDQVESAPPLLEGHVYEVTYAADGSPLSAKHLGRIEPSDVGSAAT